MNTIITPEEIATARDLGACEPALDWLTSAPRTWGEVVERHGGWILEHAAARLTAARLDACAERAPWAALEHAAARLTAERLDACATRAPREALRYAAHLVTPERIDWCAGLVPGLALRYAADRLTPARLVHEVVDGVCAYAER